jgi:hypothetical protein
MSPGYVVITRVLLVVSKESWMKIRMSPGYLMVARILLAVPNTEKRKNIWQSILRKESGAEIGYGDKNKTKKKKKYAINFLETVAGLV